MSGFTSPVPYIKDEPDEFAFSPGPQYANPQMNNSHNQAFGSWQGHANDSLEPNDISTTQRNFTINNMSSSFIAGNSGVTDDDLMASLDLADSGMPTHMHNGGMPQAQFPTPQSFSAGAQSSMQMPARQQPSFTQTYSHTPDGQPINSPFVNGFDFSQWQPRHSLNASMAGGRPGLGSEQRTSSLSKSPMTPGVGNLQIGTPDSGSFPSQPVPVNQSLAGHRKSNSQQWESSIGSGYSYIDSPLGSPNGHQHVQISEVLNKGSALSAPQNSGSGKIRPSIEDKKARRRASHNEVERKRRNNINNQIMILSRLVPAHRLEDDNIRRSINTNTALPASVTGGAGMSPPQATSLLAGGSGRRATGGITQGLPLDDKDKQPAKGDVLNSSVGWTKDLMWLLNRLMHRETVMMEAITDLGGHVPIQMTDEENRMRTELQECLERNGVDSFDYSRRHGSNLWVPGHTDPTGQPIANDGSDEAALSAQMGNEDGLDNQFWAYPSETPDPRSSVDFKEEDEYINMDM